MIAAALFHEEISPRLDCCDGFLLVEKQGDKPRFLRIDASALNRQERLMLLVERKIERLLVGGIRRCDYFFLVQSGVEVLTGLTGNAHERLAEALDGRLQCVPPFVNPTPSPFCTRRRRRRRGG